MPTEKTDWQVAEKLDYCNECIRRMIYERKSNTGSHPVIACGVLRCAIKRRFFLGCLYDDRDRPEGEAVLAILCHHGRGMNLTAKMNDRQNRNVDRFKGFVGYIH